MSVVEPGICYCSCHDSYGSGFATTIHCTPCCTPCPVCKQNLDRFGASQHIEICQKQRTELLARYETAQSQGEF